MGKFSKSRHSKQNDRDLIEFNADNEQNDSGLFKLTPAGTSSQYNVRHALTAEEVSGISPTPKKPVKNIEMESGDNAASPIDALKEKMMNARRQNQKSRSVSHTSVPQVSRQTIKPPISEETLLEKCKAFITDGGHDMPDVNKSTYTLESVDSIINSSEKKAAELLKKLNSIGNVDVTFDSLSKKEPAKPSRTEEFKTYNPTPKFQPEDIKTEFITQKSDLSEPVKYISDVDANIEQTRYISFEKPEHTKPMEDISSGTKIIDLSKEIFDDETEPTEDIPPEFEQNFENDFSVPDDYKSYADAKRIGTSLIKKKKHAFSTSFFTLLLTGVLSLFCIDKISSTASESALPIIVTVIYAVILLINFDIFKNFKTLFTPQKRPETVCGITAISAIFYAIFCTTAKLNPAFVLTAAALQLVFKTFAVYTRQNYLLSNFKIVATKERKFAVKLIDDRQTTFAMAKNSIDGDVLVAGSVETDNTTDFLTHSYCDRVMDGRLGTFTVCTIICAAILGLFSGVYLASAEIGFGTFAASLICAFAPCVFFTDILPLSSAAKFLNKKGAMISGTNAAREIENANASVMDAADLFPKGSVTLFNMKVLDKNRIDDTLIAAAAIAKQMNSPLFGIFSDIAQSASHEPPTADSVKYEDRMGISGWVGNKHIFIGNRTILEAHGINTPPLEIDKKILRNGYFPVYIACNEKPCALLIVKYGVRLTVAATLQKLCNSGITVLVNSSDPNITEDMICDYFGLYSDSVKVMSNAGVHLYKNATEKEESVSAFAAHRGNPLGFNGIITAAAKIKRTVSLLTVFQIVTAVLSVIGIAYFSIVKLGNITSGYFLILYTAAQAALTYLINLLNKPA